jgi:nicotinate dehydrogenase subunit B
MTHTLTRRGVLASGGALIVSFALDPRGFAQDQHQAVKLPGSLNTSRFLDAWIRVDAEGVTVFTGKAELGQGIKTAILQVAAEELSVALSRIRLVTADTAQTPNEGFTSGSQSMQQSATAIRHAASQARELLVAAAAGRWGVDPDHLKAADGAVAHPDGRHIRYSDLVSDALLHVEAQPQSRLKQPATYQVIGHPVPRIDIPAKATGAVTYVQDLRFPAMAHARIVRPPSYGARLTGVDKTPAEGMRGVIKVVRDGSFLAVLADQEFRAVQAADALSQSCKWEEHKTLPDSSQLPAWVRSQRTEDFVIHNAGSGMETQGIHLSATYSRPFLMHGSIGPSCAVAVLDSGTLTVWTHAQGVYPLRNALAEWLHLQQDRIRCIHMDGSGCYGHNGADDVAADAALLATALPGRAVRVQWMRDQEHSWEPYGAAMATQAQATLDANGNVAAWQYDVWSNSHSTRPSVAGNLMPAWHVAASLKQPPAEIIPQPNGGGDRNAIPLYKFPNARVEHHFIPDMPVRVSALRALGAHMNVFSIESFMDELAQAANIDPVEFRLRHLEDARARDVIRLAAQKFDWSNNRSAPGYGRGFGFAQYKNLAAYTAVAADLQIDHETGAVHLLRVIAANDSGEVVNPDGVRNQIEGAIVQSISWTLHESVSFDDTRITCRDWTTYPILRFTDLPEALEVHLIDRPGQPYLGTGEAVQGPTAAAIGNALTNALGVRLRELPLTPNRIKAAIGV